MAPQALVYDSCMSRSCLNGLSGAHSRGSLNFFTFKEHIQVWFIASTLGLVPKPSCMLTVWETKLDKVLLIWHSSRGVGMGIVFQRNWGHHSTIMFGFTASTNTCDALGVLHRKCCRSLGFCGVGKGKKRIAAHSRIPRSWRLISDARHGCLIRCRGLLYRQRPRFRSLGSNVTYLSSLKS